MDERVISFMTGKIWEVLAIVVVTGTLGLVVLSALFGVAGVFN